MRWEVIWHHDGSHAHPYASGTGAELSFQAPAPEDLHSTGASNHLEVKLTATDSRGLSRTITRRLQPHRIGVVFATRPPGLELRVNGSRITAGKALRAGRVTR